MYRLVILAILTFAPSLSSAWEPGACKGTKEDRIIAFKEVALKASQYIEGHGRFPNLWNEYVPEITSGTPEILHDALIVSSPEENILEYWCDLKRTEELTETEICKIKINSKKVTCSVLIVKLANESE